MAARARLVRGRSRGPWPLLLLFAAAAPACTTSRPRALVIGVEGLTAERVALASTPALDRLAWNGSATFAGEAPAADAAAPPISEPSAPGAAGWASLLTGARASDGDAPTLFQRLKAARPRAETACFPADPDLGLVPDALLGPSRAAVDCFIAPDADAPAAERDRAAATAAAEALASAGRFGGARVELAFVQLAQAAEGGGAAPVEAVDALIARLCDAIAKRAERREEDWLVLVTGEGGAPAAAVVIAADGVLPRAARVASASHEDLAATLCEWLAIPSEPWTFPGRSVLP